MTDEKITEFKQHNSELSDTPDAQSLIEQLQDLPLDLLNLYGLLETVTVAPTGKPTKLFDQIKLYTDSLATPTVWRLYVYFTSINAWHYVALT